MINNNASMEVGQSKNPFFVFGFIIILATVSVSCHITSSAKGRMSIKVETLEVRLMDSLQKQNAGMLGSLRNFRVELNRLKKANN